MKNIIVKPPFSIIFALKPCKNVETRNCGYLIKNYPQGEVCGTFRQVSSPEGIDCKCTSKLLEPNIDGRSREFFQLNLRESAV